jgi:GNAT superfamily N-acetyltransferase
VRRLAQALDHLWRRPAQGRAGPHARSRHRTGKDPRFFVEPDMADQGPGSMPMRHCTEQAPASGFTSLELAATMAGVPLYMAHGFVPVHQPNLSLADGRVTIPLTPMRKAIG